MRFITFLILTAVAGFIFQTLFPWWILVLVGLVLGFSFTLRPAGSFAAGFLGGSLLWGGYATWLSHLNEGILAVKIGELMGGAEPFVPLLATALLGGLLAGLGALTGALGQMAITSKNNSSRSEAV